MQTDNPLNLVAVWCGFVQTVLKMKLAVNHCFFGLFRAGKSRGYVHSSILRRKLSGWLKALFEAA